MVGTRRTADNLQTDHPICVEGPADVCTVRADKIQ